MSDSNTSSLPRAAQPEPDAAPAVAVLQQALQWQVIFWSGEATDRDRMRWQSWLAADPAHARAWAQVQRTDEQLQTLASPAAEVLRSADVRRCKARRTVLGMAGLLAGAGIVGYGLRQTAQWQMMMADDHTGYGERRHVELADGTRVTLGSATAIDVCYSAQARQLLLRTGEIFIVTAPDSAGRPFLVQTTRGSVQALGTRFNVRESGEQIQVAVQDGAVAIRPAGMNPGDVVRLDAGQQTCFDHTKVEAPEALQISATVWTRGLLVAERMRLEDFLAELGRYRSGVLRCDPAVRDLIVSGVYSLDDTDQSLRLLAQALPVQVQTVTRWWITIGPHPFK